MTKKWLGNQTQCDICKEPFTNYPTFYDGRIERGGWALMCLECWQFLGVGLGLGMGQEYDSKTKKKIRG